MSIDTFALTQLALTKSSNHRTDDSILPQLKPSTIQTSRTISQSGTRPGKSTLAVHQSHKSLQTARKIIDSYRAKVKQRLSNANLNPQKLLDCIKRAEANEGSKGLIQKAQKETEDKKKKLNALVHQRHAKEKVLQDLNNQLIGTTSDYSHLYKKIEELRERNKSVLEQLEKEVDYTKSLKFMLYRKTKEVRSLGAPLATLRSSLISAGVKLYEFDKSNIKNQNDFILRKKEFKQFQTEISKEKSAIQKKMKHGLVQYEARETLHQFKNKLKERKLIQDKIEGFEDHIQKLREDYLNYQTQNALEKDTESCINELDKKNKFIDKIRGFASVREVSDVLKQYDHLQTCKLNLNQKKDNLEQAILDSREVLKELQNSFFFTSAQETRDSASVCDKFRSAKIKLFHLRRRNKQNNVVLFKINQFLSSYLYKLAETPEIQEISEHGLIEAFHVFSQKLLHLFELSNK